MYKIVDSITNIEEAGTWYGNELQLVSKDYQDSLYKIEKIIRSEGVGNKKRHFVKWKYWPDNYNSWVKADEIQNLKK